MTTSRQKEAVSETEGSRKSGAKCWDEELSYSERGAIESKKEKKKEKRGSQESEDALQQEELLRVQLKQSGLTSTNTHLPQEDSVCVCVCVQSMKKHSARVAPLSSYSTQVLTCPNSEGNNQRELTQFRRCTPSTGRTTSGRLLRSHGLERDITCTACQVCTAFIWNHTVTKK